MQPAATERTDAAQRALSAIVDDLATDIGRLSRRATTDSSLAFLAERLAHTVEQLDGLAQPTAADLYTDNLAITGSHAADVALEEALATVTARQRSLRSTLGLNSDGHHKPTHAAQALEQVA